MPHRILVVDDNPTNLKLVSYLLRHKGFEVETATDAATALALAGAFRPSAIVTDLMMPGMDGYAFTRALRQVKGTREVPVIALTAVANEAEAREAGIDEVLHKPIDTRTFTAHIASHLSD